MSLVGNVLTGGYARSGELLLDQQRFQDAVEKFDRAIEIEKKKSGSPSLILFTP